MDIRFDGKRALVTGAGKGIGRGIAINLAECGAQVVAISRTQADLDSLKQQVPSIETHAIDLTDWDATRALVQSLGEIDLLVNNAGTVILTSFFNVTKEELDRQFDTNYMAVYNISQVVAEDMVKRGKGGAIVMISSQASFRAIAGHSVYCSTKGAIDQLTRCLALELGPHKIRVNCINPTITKTELAMIAADWGNPEKAKPVLDRIPLRRFAEIEEMAKTTLFLLSDQASMISGTILPVDGGLTATL